jgi:hypothetical protein
MARSKRNQFLGLPLTSKCQDCARNPCFIHQTEDFFQTDMLVGLAVSVDDGKFGSGDTACKD